MAASNSSNDPAPAAGTAVSADAASGLRARVRIVLVAPSHPGNIGEAGFADHPEAVALATHGIDLLRSARVHANLTEALAGVRLAFAMTG